MTMAEVTQFSEQILEVLLYSRKPTLSFVLLIYSARRSSGSVLPFAESRIRLTLDKEH